MNQRQAPDANLLLAIAALEARARQADTLNALAFSIANDAHPLLRFRQALVFDCLGRDWSLLAVSGLARPAEDSPYLLWLERAAAWLAAQPTPEPSTWITVDGAELPGEIAAGWREWWPYGIWCLRIADRAQRTLGMAIFLLDAPPDPARAAEMQRLGETWSYCWAALTRSRSAQRWRMGTRRKALLAAAIAVSCVLPVRQSVLAPAEIVSRDAEIVTSPLDGVVRALHVRPNQAVSKGDLLLSLDDTTLRNRLAVSLKAVAVADAELNAASQRSFDSTRGRDDIALLTGRARERRAELAAIRAQLARIDVVAPRDGVAVYGDPNDWLGKPVATGERILLLADPATPAMLIDVPVADAIALDPGAQVKLYLAAHPLSVIDGRIVETSYQAIVTPDGIAAYRVRATIEAPSPVARLGQRGTAKIYGERVVLAYYLLRRPLAALRRWSGL